MTILALQNLLNNASNPNDTIRLEIKGILYPIQPDKLFTLPADAQPNEILLAKDLINIKSTEVLN